MLRPSSVPSLRTLARRGACLGAGALLCASLALTGCSADSSSPTAATFGSNVITEQQISDYTDQARVDAGCDDDKAWEEYLAANGYTQTTWREEAIRSLATRTLVEERAAELGITADQATVDRSIQQLRDSQHLQTDEDWKAYLERKGTTEEQLRDKYAFASVQQQVISKEAGLDSKQTEEAVDQYVKQNLGDRVIRKFSVVSFPSDQKKQAAAFLAECKKLDPSKRAERFQQKADELAKTAKDLPQGDLGWNLGYNLEGILNMDTVLTIHPNDPYPDVASNDGSYQIYLCTGEYVFTKDSRYQNLPDDSLRETVRTAALATSWSTVASTYLAQLVDSANVQVVKTPSK
ncbi:MAG: SurA N-terminal domain-containing protein [Coriobacteriia bacterium]|nr:SurA N-terminal domain-containing protein [Coriobacteriia bacterium]